nr:molybdopterin-dependent oxidoreductase [Kibdelosporangium sp. MJ126-NF4]CEL12877.1 Anaerobic dimethyl sulfoxide reductase chain A [Kibdelosporangium sp. MJ126-NF4]
MIAHLTHWGAFVATTDGESLTSVRPWPGDPDPAPLIDNVASAQHHSARIDQPYVRRGWLEHGPGTPGRGNDTYVPVSWETALELLADELRRVYREHGPNAVYGGSYGWASAGRFHHAQSQLHRFLNTLGGYVRHVGSYSLGTAHTFLPHVIGSATWLMDRSTSHEVLADQAELIVAFGGISSKNSVVAPGGVTRHNTRSWVAAARANGCRFVSISPLRDDTPPEAQAEWLAPRPGTDAAAQLALAYVLDQEGLTDKDFVDRYTTGFDRFADYLRGVTDGVPKSPEWAEPITGLPATRLRELARQMAAARTLVTVSWSLQRTQYGEQPMWLGVVLAAMLGQLGLPGGGFGFGYGSAASIGRPLRSGSAPTLPQGTNGTDEFIPVARIADMLLNPGAEYDFNGERRHYPNIKLVYWAGGNPFHHHQDLARLRDAFDQTDTVVVHDPFWSSTTRHADIVIPSTMSIERDDFGVGQGDTRFLPMPALTTPHGQAHDDYDTFTELARRLEVEKEFTEGRTTGEWLRHLYREWHDQAAGLGHDYPEFDEFMAGDGVDLPVHDPKQVSLAEFRADPDAHPLRTPSGRIEIYSETLAGFGYQDCQGHPMWQEPDEWLGGPRAADYPFHLVANQPKSRLHSQLDIGAHSASTKIEGREPVRMHPADAEAAGLVAGSVVRLRNERGSCLAGLVLSEDVRRGVLQLSTGAWYDPDPQDPSFCRGGNPNVLTTDRPSSQLSQACTGQHALVTIEAFTGPLPPSGVHHPPVDR